MKRYSKVLCVASRGRGDNNAQRFEARTDGCANTITSVKKDNYIMAIRFPCVLSKQRSEQGKQIRREYKNDVGVPYNRVKAYLPTKGGYFSTVTTFSTENLIMTTFNNQDMELTYHPNPTKEDLLEYFGQRIKIRKMTEREAFRLQDVDDSDIDKIQAYPFKTLAERAEAIAKADKKELARIKRESICKTAQYKLAGNSITTACLVNIFRTMFIPNQPENERQAGVQLSLFDF